MTYHSTFQGVVPSLKANGFSEESISAYEKRIEGIETHYEVGELKLTLPDGFVHDESPFKDERDD
jgi:hypothetical protein